MRAVSWLMLKHVVTIIQARTSSAHLPNKVLLPLGDQPVLLHLVARVKAAEYSGTVVVATTDDSADSVIVDLCRSAGIHCFRGHSSDLLDRHFQAALEYNADAIVKIPSDCPLIDPHIIDKVILEYLYHAEECDYVSNLHPATYPNGNDVEIMSLRSLETAWRESKRSADREHTTPFIWDNPKRFRLRNTEWEGGKDCSQSHRWALDYPEDYDFIKAVFEELHPRNQLFGLNEILELLQRKPHLRRLNEKHLGVNWQRPHAKELQSLPRKPARIWTAFKLNWSTKL